MICIDSDVFLIDLRYRDDQRAAPTGAFLRRVRESGEGATTIFNLLEVVGVLSFDLNPKQLLELYYHLPTKYGIEVVPSADVDTMLPALRIGDVFEIIRHQTAFGDALIATLVKRLRDRITAFVTWNDRHFLGRMSVPVFTPITFAPH